MSRLQRKIQFRALYRLSMAKLIDLEMISSRGDLYGLFARSWGLLLALSLTLLGLMVTPYVRHGEALRHSTRVWNDEEFLVSINLAVSGIFCVLAWNNVLPDRRDCLVLGTLPVRVRTIAMARLAAVLTWLTGLTVTVNAFTGMTFPFLMVDRGQGLRAVAAWWVTVAAGSLFAISWTLALQGAAAQVLRWSAFLRVSAALQMMSLFAVLGLFFLTPALSTTVKTNPALLSWFPSYWFTGLFHLLRGDSNAALGAAGWMAIRNLSLTMALAALTFALSWWRHMKSIVETADISSGSGRSVAAYCGNLLVKAIFRRPLDRAMVLFTARTALRSRQHRLLLAVYGGTGFALAVTFSRGLFAVRSRGLEETPSIPLLVTGMLAVVCAMNAMRAIFVLPHVLPANWILRITAVQRPSEYFAAVRRAMLLLAAVPSWIMCGTVYASIWPAKPAMEATVILVLLGLILMDSLLYQFSKFPFACSWLPDSGQSVNTVRRLAYGLLFLVAAPALAGIERWAMRSDGRFLVLCGVLGGLALWLWRRGREFARSPAYAVQYDDRPKPEIFALDLRPDGEWSSEQAWAEVDVR